MKRINIYILLAAMLAVPAFGRAQTILSVTGPNGTTTRNVGVTIDSTILTNDVSLSDTGNKNKRNIVWIEYGDGNFSIHPETSHAFYSLSGASQMTMLVKSTGIYDQGGKPPKHTATVATVTTTQTPPQKSVLLDNDKNVHITPNVFDVVPGDTMMFALTYRKPAAWEQGVYHLVFFYNKHEMGVFEPIDNSTYPVKDSNNGHMDINRIRTYHNEAIKSKSHLSQYLKEQYRDALDSSECLAFDVMLNDTNEHHIFLTLLPRNDISLENMRVNMTLALAKIVKTVVRAKDNIPVPSIDTIPPPQEYSHTSNIAPSHDPNWHNVFPNCIVLPKNNQVMKHHIHFQNTGPGPATSVRIATRLPTGLTANDIDTTGWAIGGVRNNPGYALNVDRVLQRDSIIFTFVRNTSITKVLYGARELHDAPVNVKTMGDIYFTCKAMPGIADTIVSCTSIYFDSNPAVITNEAKVEFRQCCNCDKGCKKIRGRFLKWLLCKKC